MKNTAFFKIQKEAIVLLLANSLWVIPFNIAVALLMSAFLLYHKMPPLKISVWFFCIVILCCTRWIFTKRMIRIYITKEKTQSILLLFVLFTFFMGVTWGSCYLIFLPYLTSVQEFVIILIFGGMCTGAIASLSVYLPAYYAFMLPMFLPVIIYNYYLLNFDRVILATTFLLFVLMLMIVTKMNGKLTRQIFKLAEQKELLIDELKVISVTDSLTGLYNRRYFIKALQKEINRAKRNRSSLNLVSIDIDNFKLINDTFGHPYGDKFLIYTAELLKNNIQRSNDTVFRLGGDEFMVIISNMSMNDVMSLCTNIKEKFKKVDQSDTNRTSNEQSVLDKVTLSMGIAHVSCDYLLDAEGFILASDEALYQAKKGGKNKIIMHQVS